MAAYAYRTGERRTRHAQNQRGKPRTRWTLPRLRDLRKALSSAKVKAVATRHFVHDIDQITIFKLIFSSCFMSMETISIKRKTMLVFSMFCPHASEISLKHLLHWCIR